LTQTPSSDSSSRLLVGIYLSSGTLAEAVLQQLNGKSYQPVVLDSVEAFCRFVESEKQQLDCLILAAGSELPQLITWLHGQAIVLPLIIIRCDALAEDAHLAEDVSGPGSAPFYYHLAEVLIDQTQVEAVEEYIDRAIAQFLNLSPVCRLGNAFLAVDLAPELADETALLFQQRRLTEKLKERLGYLGVYYKRNPNNFLRHLPPEQRQELLKKLKADYREIVLCYFADDGHLNQRIDDFVNTAFFTDIPVSQVVEIHMELMDEFSKQLKLEGRSDEMLLDYRLTLIDAIAHLCEMYRRSIPRES